MASNNHVYSFGAGTADGDGSLRELLGGKGANLAEMAGHPSLRLPVPAGFTITTGVCTYYLDHGRYPPALAGQVRQAIARVEKTMRKKFGSPRGPLLVSVRSGARKSMPGMMESVLNIGLTTRTIPGLIRETGGNARFVYDAYRRLITMYSDVVMEKAAGVEPLEDQGIRRQLEGLLEAKKSALGVEQDTELGASDLEKLCKAMKARVEQVLGAPFPDEAEDQLWGGVGAVFSSWKGKRAIAYRNIEGIPHDWGTAVNVQSMVFGNMGEDCATGVAFTRDPGTGRKFFYGEYLVNAQGEDVVAGIRTPWPINADSATENNRDEPTLESSFPAAYQKLVEIQEGLETHYHDMQDIEFTIEREELFMLQCRVGKRNGPAAVRMAVDMVKERLITPEEAVTRVTADQLNELLHPVLDPSQESSAEIVTKGLPAGPGGAAGQIVFTSQEAVDAAEEGRQVVLVREETNPEDVEGMRAAQAILTARGGMTSHAALVARGWGKCCIVGCADLDIDVVGRRVQVDGVRLGPDDWISLNGSRGYVYRGRLDMIQGEVDESLDEFLELCDSIRRLKVRANADTPADARKGLSFGAEGIGLFRTEHMFYGENCEEPLNRLRRMILAPDRESRIAALGHLFGFIKADIKATLEAMEGLPVTIRLLDPPLHEFIPHEERKLAEIAIDLGISLDEAKKRADGLRETNPMMGHRGVRLAITYPEITEAQVRAILEATAELLEEGKEALPEIMVPVVAAQPEMAKQFELIERVHRQVREDLGVAEIPHLVGTMIEIPRAALIAGELAKSAEFFSFGTNDLTQMGFGFSRDDSGGFLPEYLEQGILPADPFQTIDRQGIGELVTMGIERGRAERPDLKVGICGEHGGDAESVKFCHDVGMDYVSCSPFRVPIARLAAAQAVVEERARGAATGAATKETAGNASGTRAMKTSAVKKAPRAKKAAKKTAKKTAKKAKKAPRKARKTAKRKSSPRQAPRKAAKRTKRAPKRQTAKRQTAKRQTAKRKTAKRSAGTSGKSASRKKARRTTGKARGR
ncbi:MAG: pyruvate, phosphate dikinase [Planctomycetota bacterium]|nr:pyruvate, phosphate dikinase [Planctomycetota bacterium]